VVELVLGLDVGGLRAVAVTVALGMAVEVAKVARIMGVDLTIAAGNTLVYVGSLATCA
jgi:hypothetical protein